MNDDIDALVASRLAVVNAYYAPTPAIKEAIALIERTRALSRQGGEGYCCLIWGPSGVGKSRLLKRYLQRQPEAEPGTRPVLYVETPTPFSQMAFLRSYLYALGRPVIPSQDLDIVAARVVRELERHKVKVILQDEINHVTDHRKKGGSIPYWVTDTIKQRLLDQAKVTVVMTGIKAAKELFDLNTQLLTRRAGIQQLHGYALDDPTDFRRMLVSLGTYERAAELPVPTFPGPKEDNEAVEALGRRVHAATDGLHGPLANLAKRAAELAIRKGAPGFTRDILAEACASLADLDDKDWHNPFVGDRPKVAAKKPDETRVTPLHSKKAAA